MCGIAGWIGGFQANVRAIALDMAGTLEHRGPDGEGIWIDEDRRVALAHRRLSIIDLSDAGYQPMESACGRFVLAFNGEIYNHLELRAELEKANLAPAWRGRSDTESLLASISAWGLEKTLKAAVGMFAIALWDKRERAMSLARDRMGEKPLYYGWQKGVFIFGSELKALKAHPSFNAQINRRALGLMLQYSCVPAPYSIYKNIHKLMPGQFLTVSADPRQTDANILAKSYWKLNDAVTSSRNDRFSGTDAEAIELLEAQLLKSIGSQMLSDVPLGAFLSGGIDSSAIVALMQAQSSRAVNTYSIGFDDKDYDEAVHAKAVARHLGTAHTELYVTSNDALNVIPKLSNIYCEPFSDSSQISTFLVSELAQRHVKVALSGDAGDELFGGYNRYLTAWSVWRKMQRLPRPVRRGIANTLTSVNVAGWDKVFEVAHKVLPNRLQIRTPGEKAHKLASVLLADDGAAFYRQLVSHVQDPATLVPGFEEPPTLLTQSGDWPQTDNFIEWMMAMDAQTYLPDDILAKVDRAAMANSLETRVPYLDHRVVELAWRMPLSMKIRNGEGKWLLRQVLYKHVPKKLIDRPKMGFANPVHEWLRSPLREWAEELLDRKRLVQEGYFSPDPIRRLWDAHLSGQSNEQDALWNILMFQAWLAEE